MPATQSSRSLAGYGKATEFPTTCQYLKHHCIPSSVTHSENPSFQFETSPGLRLSCPAPKARTATGAEEMGEKLLCDPLVSSQHQLKALSPGKSMAW